MKPSKSSRMTANARRRIFGALKTSTESEVTRGPCAPTVPTHGWTHIEDSELPSDLPDRKYFMVVYTVGATFGGMTAMCLERAGLFSKRGKSATVVTFDAYADYPQRIEGLRADGRLAPGVQFKNIFQELSEIELDGSSDLPVNVSPGPLTAKDANPIVETRDDGSVFRKRFPLAEEPEKDALKVYFRPDGSAFLVDRVIDGKGRRTIDVVTRSGYIHETFEGPGSFYRWWIDALVAEGPSAVMVDSAFAARFIAPWVPGEHLKVALIHANHVEEGTNPMTSVVGSIRKATLKSAADWDAVVFLTAKQKSDFTRRFGERSNIYRVPNPRQRLSHLPEFGRRDKVRGISVTRLEKGKNVDETIAIMKLVREQIPDAYIDVYGTGSQEVALRQLAQESGVSEGVHFHGHVSNAADEFSTAGYCVFPSQGEGLPLAMMESLGRGCPVVSYDINYGPSDLLLDGVNGYLVPTNNVRRAAEKVVQIILDGELQQDMSRHAWEHATMFSEEAVVDEWAKVLNEATERRRHRVEVEAASLSVNSLTFDRDTKFTVNGRLSLKARDLGCETVVPLIRLVLRSRSTGETVAESPVDAADNGEFVSTVKVPSETDDLIDTSIEWTWENSAGSQRLAAPGGNGGYFPYLTAYGNVSFKIQ